MNKPVRPYAAEYCSTGTLQSHTWHAEGYCTTCGCAVPPPEMQFERELTSLLNRYSRENASNTPDFILAQFLLDCLAAWNRGVQQRETWYGRDARPGSMTASVERT